MLVKDAGFIYIGSCKLRGVGVDVMMFWWIFKCIQSVTDGYLMVEKTTIIHIRIFLYRYH